LSWHNPTDPKEHISKARGHALLTASEWQCTWTDTNGREYRQVEKLSKDMSLIASLIQHAGPLSLADIPGNSPLYLATANFVLAPATYSESGVALLHKVLDETIPELAVSTSSLDWPQDSCLVAEIQPSFLRVWKNVVKNGKVVPLVERDLAWLHNNEDQGNLVCVHILPGFFQISVKKSGQLRLCNAFRFREQEEARMMLQTALNQFYLESQLPEVHVAHAGETEADIASFLVDSIKGASLLSLTDSYWEQV
jgi:hypothetical protein